MNALVPSRIAFLRMSLALLMCIGTGCKRRDDSKLTNDQPAAARTEAKIDLSVDRAVFRGSWMMALAKDPAPLVTLAQSHPAWAKLIPGETHLAFGAFSKSLDKGDVSVRIGAARAALEIAEAHHAVAQLSAAITPQILSAQATRPGSKEFAPWRAYISARHAGLRGGDQAKALALIPADHPAHAWGMLIIDRESAAGALLRGEQAGLDAELPKEGQDVYKERLIIPLLVAAGRVDEAEKRFARIQVMDPDFEFGSGDKRVALYDPAAMGAGTVVYAALVSKALEGVEGWPQLLSARARILAGDIEGSNKILEALQKSPAPTAPLALMLGSGALDVDDLKAEVVALQARNARRAGNVERADTLAKSLPTDTVARRVLRAWAGAGDVKKSFPSDRDVLAGALADELTKLGKKAAGITDVTDLALVERYVDAVQRRYAVALIESDAPTFGVKAIEASEEKSAAFTPSARNRISALAWAAAENVGIGRPRVALKYLSRLKDRLPAVRASAEMLRDLLSLRAMEQSGGATVGQ